MGGIDLRETSTDRRDGRYPRLRAAILAVAALLASHACAAADPQEEVLGTPEDELTTARRVIEGAGPTFADFVADPEMSWFRSHLKDAKGLLIVPVLIKGGFFFGGSGGTGALFVRDERTGQWSYPAFYTLGAVSFGLQFGGQAAQVILMVMSERGLDKLMSTKVQLGADASVAAGPVGEGAQVATTDIVQFARAKGLFVGLSVEGAVVVPRDRVNAAFYGRPLKPVEILKEGKAVNPEADPIRAELAKYAN